MSNPELQIQSKPGAHCLRFSALDQLSRTRLEITLTTEPAVELRPYCAGRLLTAFVAALDNARPVDLVITHEAPELGVPAALLYERWVLQVGADPQQLSIQVIATEDLALMGDEPHWCRVSVDREALKSACLLAAWELLKEVGDN